MSTFYQVTAQRWLPAQQNTVVGYYRSESDATYVATLLSNAHIFSQQIGFTCARFSGSPADPKAVVIEQLDHPEMQRVISQFFLAKNKRKRNPESDSDSDEDSDTTPPAAKTARTSRVPAAFVTPEFNSKKAGELFQAGIESAKESVQKKYGDKHGDIYLAFHGSGVYAMSAGPKEVDPTELQDITITVWKTDEEPPLSKKIGSVLPEKGHLFTLKPADEIEREIIALVDQFFLAQEADAE